MINLDPGDDIMFDKFREKLSEGVVGIFSKTDDAAIIEAMGYAGADFVIIDLEHGPNNVHSIQGLIRAAEISGLFPIVRVKEGAPWVISEALDVGAGGVQVPQISCKRDAEEVIKHAKFAPMGERGVCRFVRAARYSALNRFDYFEKANKSLIILQIEGQNGINNLDEILQVEGIDIIFIGPYDLSQSLGIVGDIDNPLVEKKMLEVIDKCKQRNVVVGTFTDTIENADKWRRLGVKYIAHSVDIGIFHDAVKSLMQEIKNNK